MASITLRPIGGSGNNWNNIGNAYDGNESTNASVSTSLFGGSRTLTLNFDTTVIPSGATINSATLTMRSKGGKTTITVNVDINGNSEYRVISQQQSAEATNYTADVASYMSDLQNVVVTVSNYNFSANTFDLHELWIDVDYAIPTTHTITASANTGGSITPSGATTVLEGGSQTYTISANTGYRIKSVTVDGTNQGAITSYTFSNVTSDHTISAVFEQIPTYTITFKDYDGSIIDTQTVPSGGSATPPTPTRTGYDFTGWSGGSYTNVTSNVVLTAQYSIKTFTVRFLDWNNDVLDTQTVDYGGSATPPNDPTRDGYTFTGWQGTYTNITANTDIVAQYKIKTFTVRFLDYNGNVLDTQIIEEGSNATPPNNPSRTGYDFIGWQGSYTNITRDTDIIAQYKIKTFTVRFLDWNNSVINTQTVNYGSSATPPNNPTRTGYTFNGWNGTYTNITANTDITATYTINTYTVRFLDWNGDVLYTQTIDYGSDATPPSDPTRDGYRFTGWSGSYTNITADTDITAQYIKVYTITSSTIDSNGSITPSVVVDEGGSQTFIITPKAGYRIKRVIVNGIDQGAISSYTFTNVNENSTIEVEFEAIPTYTINITCGDNGTTNPSGTITVSEGENASIVITANFGYLIDKVIQDNIESSGNDQETMTIEFTNITANHTLTVSFKVVPIVVAAIEVNKLYAREFFEDEPNISLYIDGIHALDIYEDLNEDESIYVDENGILHIHQFIEEVK